MARGGSEKGSSHFEDVRMNPTTKKDHPTQDPDAINAEADAVHKNVTGR